MVYGSKIRVKAVNTQDNTLNMYIIPWASSAIPGWVGNSVYNPGEQPYAKKTILFARGYTQGGNVKILSNYMSVKKIQDERGPLDPTMYAGYTGGLGVGSNPSKEFLWIIYTTNFGFNNGGGPVAITQSVLCDIEITYYAKFRTREMMPQS